MTDLPPPANALEALERWVGPVIVDERMPANTILIISWPVEGDDDED